jgi:hypothetical protein
MNVCDMDDSEAIRETLKILSDDDAAAQLRRCIREAKKGSGTPWEEAKKSL